MLRRQRGVKDIALPFFNLGVRLGCVVNATPRPLYSRERYPVPVVQETGTSGSVWTGAKNLAPHRDSSPEPPSP